MNSNRILEHDQAIEAGDWAPNICKALCVDEYINLPHGKYFLELNDFYSNHIDLSFIKLLLPSYKTGSKSSIECLSI